MLVVPVVLWKSSFHKHGVHIRLGHTLCQSLVSSQLPFGVDTPLSASVGFSVLGAAPPQSRRMWRLDFAFPVKGESRGRVEVRLTSLDLTRTFRVEPRDIYNSRERSVPSNVFNWP